MNSTEKKQVKFWDKKWGLCLFSVFCAVILWFFVSSTYGTDETTIITDVPISIDLTDITQRYKLELIDIIGPDDLTDRKVDVTIKGKKIIINQINRDDIVVTAQVSHIATAGSQTLSLKYECTNPLLDVSFPSDNSANLIVFVDRISEKSFESIPVVVDGNVVTEEGYLSEIPYSNITSLNLKGPESIITTIDSVAVKTKVNETLKETVTFDGTLVFLDADGNEVTSDNISHDFTDKITVTVPVKMTKRLKLSLNFKNVPTAYSESMLSYTITPSNITVKGSPDAISAAFDETSDTLVIGEVDFAKLTKDNNPMAFPINLSSGIELTEEIGEVTVKFNLNGISSKSMNLSMENVKLSIVNNSSTHTATISTATLKNLTVYGPSSQLRKLSESDFLVTVDLSDKDAFVGNCIVNATITVPGKDKCWVVGTYEVEVSIRNAS